MQGTRYLSYLLAGVVALGACGKVSDGTDMPDGGAGGTVAVHADAAPSFVRAGGQTTIAVTVTRTGLAGAVHVAVAAPPAGLVVDPIDIAVGADRGELVVHAVATAAFARSMLAIEASAGDARGTATAAIEVIGAPGALDPTFGTAGVQVIAGSPVDETPQFAIAQGERVVVGIATKRGTQNGIVVVRTARDGTRDAAFGTAGELFLDPSPIGLTGALTARAVEQDDGKIVIAGAGSNGADLDPYVVRITADGQIDGALSLRRVDTSTQGLSVNALAIGPDGKIALGGSRSGSSTNDGWVMRLDPATGQGDLLFSPANGIRTFTDQTFTTVDGIVVQPDGRIVVMASSTCAGFGCLLATSLRRFRTDGTLDSAFGTNGIAPLTAPTGTPFAPALVSPDRLHLAIAGNVATGVGASDPAVWSVLPDGRPDLAFAGGTGVFAPAATAVIDNITTVALAPDGTIYAAGTQTDSLQTTVDVRVELVHLGATGTPMDFAAQPLVDPVTERMRLCAMALRTDHRMIVVQVPTLAASTNDTVLRAYFY